MLRRNIVGTLVLASVGLTACDYFPGTPPPGSCSPGERRCYYEPTQRRQLVLRCNDGEVQGAIWLVDDVCYEDEICDVDHCADQNPAP